MPVTMSVSFWEVSNAFAKITDSDVVVAAVAVVVETEDGDLLLLLSPPG